MADGDHVQIDKSKCFMSGECVLLAPEVFEFDEEGYPMLIDGGVAHAEPGLLARVAASCPSEAISYSQRKE